MGEPKNPVNPLPRWTKIVEQEASGIDDGVISFTSDPFGSSSYVGMRIPTLPTQAANRYLFLLASFTVPDGQRARILGYRQLLTIGCRRAAQQGASSANYTYEMPVVTPTWHFPDGNVSWHIHRLGAPNNQGFPAVNPAPLDRASMKFGFAQGPALLYQTFLPTDAGYINLAAYTPPNIGRPWGTPLTAGSHSTFYDLRTRSDTPNAWTSLNVEVEGPETVAFFASVKQTDPSSRAEQRSLPANFYQLDLPEDKFVAAFEQPNFTSRSPIYWRVGGALITEFI